MTAALKNWNIMSYFNAVFFLKFGSPEIKLKIIFKWYSNWCIGIHNNYWIVFMYVDTD